MDIKDRVVDLQRIPADQLLDHAGNPRRHPMAQRDAMQGILSEIGIAGALLAYRSTRNDNQLTLIDGHMRKEEFGGVWPVLILDLTDEEADKLLAFYDPISAMAELMAGKMAELAGQVHTTNPALQAILDRQKAESELAELMAAISEDFVQQAGGSSGTMETKGRARVRPVIWIDDLPIFEQAIRATGNPNRGEALIAVCMGYLETHSAAD